MLSETFIILPKTAVTGTGAADRYGNPQWTWPTGSTVSGRIQQVATVERIDGRDTVITSYRLVLFPSVTIGAYDRVQDAAGRTYEVDGAPLIATSPRGPHHLEVSLRHVAG